MIKSHGSLWDGGIKVRRQLADISEAMSRDPLSKASKFNWQRKRNNWSKGGNKCQVEDQNMAAWVTVRS